MPFESKAQRRFMYAKHPELAKEFEAATPKGAKLPEHKKGSKPEKPAHVQKPPHVQAAERRAGELRQHKRDKTKGK